jgi:threonine aldolase
VFHLTPEAAAAATVVDRAKGRGVLLFPFGPRTLRVVTHLDVDGEACGRAGDILVEIIDAR